MVSGRWRRKIEFHTIGMLLSVVVAMILAVLIISRLNAKLRPILYELAISQTSNHITSAVDHAVSEQAITYTDLVSLERSENGDIVAIISNMAHANALRAQLLETALEELKGLESMEFSIPLGTIYDWDLLSARGPDIGVRVLYTGTASAEFENSFSAAGINQTCHRIIFRIKADISVLLPGRQEKATVDTKVCVAETIIVGKVPETYLHLSE